LSIVRRSEGRRRMAWFVYRRSNPLRRPRYGDWTDDTIHGLLRRLVEDLRGGPTSVGTSVPACRRCGRLVRASLLPGGLCEECFTWAASATSRGSTVPCNRCGIRFSENLIQDGLCNNCRAAYGSDSHRTSSRHRRPRSSRSGSALRKAYEVLGANETASDEVIKGRYRKLVKECHADCLPQGLSGECIREANEKFHRLREAYERIMDSRNRAK
jgi:hypothetical protein